MRRASVTDASAPRHRKLVRKTSLPSSEELKYHSDTQLSPANGFSDSQSLSTSASSSMFCSPGRRKMVRFHGYAEETESDILELEVEEPQQQLKNNSVISTAKVCVSGDTTVSGARHPMTILRTVPASEEFRRVADSLRSLSAHEHEHQSSQISSSGTYP